MTSVDDPQAATDRTDPALATTCLVYVTCATPDQASEIAAPVIEERLAACANALPEMSSMYWWEGKVATETEAVLLLKTRRDLFDALKRRIVDLHPYDCPCVVALPIIDGHAPFLSWIKEQTTSTG